MFVLCKTSKKVFKYILSFLFKSFCRFEFYLFFLFLLNVLNSLVEIKFFVLIKKVFLNKGRLFVFLVRYVE